MLLIPQLYFEIIVKRRRLRWMQPEVRHPNFIQLFHCSKCLDFHYTGLFKMIVGVLTTCHTQYTWHRSICFFLFNRTTLQGFVTYLTGALYVHPLWFYRHQHDNRRSKLFVASQRWWFQWRFWFIPSVPGYLLEEEEHKPGPWHNPTERNHMGLHLENEVARRVASDHHRLMFVESQRVHI